MNFNPGFIETCPYMPADQHAHRSMGERMIRYAHGET